MLPLTDEEVTHGPDIPEVARMPIVGEVGDATVRLVDGSVPPVSRHAIARVAYAAQRSMPSYKTGYDGTVTEDDQRLYVLAAGTRAVGLVLTALQDRFWKIRWAEDGALVRDSDVPLLQRGPVVARVWVAESRRKSGLGLGLIDRVLRHLGVPASGVGWEFPFTESGATLVRRLCPTGFLSSCDAMTLALNTKPLTAPPSAA